MSAHPIKSPRKLIEVALPLDAINEAAAREKSIRHGHPSTLHLWWARRPLAAARAVLFAQLVNDPGYQQGGGFKYGMNKKDAAAARKRLFKIIADLVQWENTTNEQVLEAARAEIRRSWREVCELNQDHPQATQLFNPDKLPAFHDPFAGGGALPLEAQRLGLESHASDLNPVPVLLNKAITEVPPKFASRPPVNPIARARLGGASGSWRGTTGLAEDVRYYGAWISEEAQKRIGHLYPPVEITSEMARERPDLKLHVGEKLTIIAWLWVRTVKSPNPAFSQAEVPLASTFVLSSKAGKEAYVHPIVQGPHYRFTVKTGAPTPDAERGTKLAKANFECILSGAPISTKYIRSEACKGRLGLRLMAIVAESSKGRVYLSPTDSMEQLACSAVPTWKPDLKVTTPCHDIDRLPMYGMFTWGDAFTLRQLTMLSTLSDLVTEVRERVRQDATSSGMAEDDNHVDDSDGPAAYASAISLYLALCVSKLTSYHCTLTIWRAPEGKSGRAFGRQAIPMVWDFPECNPFGRAGGDWDGAVTDCCKVLATLPASAGGTALQCPAQELQQFKSASPIICTDPPYYDNVGYADLSDFFYVWLRKMLRTVFPTLFSTVSVPKAEELIAASHRHADKKEAEDFFLNGMTKAIRNLANSSRPDFPTVLYYAFKQTESSGNETSSKGWETFLTAVLRAGFTISGTWPMRTEQSAALKAQINSLASSVVLVCRKRDLNAPNIPRRDFIRELNAVLPEALDEMTKGSGDDRSPVAPVDLSQAIIGPGMAVFSKYAAVLEADGSPMTVRTALQLINRFLAEDDFDHDTQFCLHWFEQNGWNDGLFGQADVLARAKGTSVDGVRDAGVIESGGGKVRLQKWVDYPADWDPSTDHRLPVWEALHHLIRALKQEGESGAGRILASLKGKAESTRQLAYRLYTLCERQGWAEDARAYNELVTSWPAIETAAGQTRADQIDLFQ